MLTALLIHLMTAELYSACTRCRTVLFNRRCSVGLRKFIEKTITFVQNKFCITFLFYGPSISSYKFEGVVSMMRKNILYITNKKKMKVRQKELVGWWWCVCVEEKTDCQQLSKSIQIVMIEFLSKK